MVFSTRLGRRCSVGRRDFVRHYVIERVTVSDAFDRNTPAPGLSMWKELDLLRGYAYRDRTVIADMQRSTAGPDHGAAPQGVRAITHQVCDREPVLCQGVGHLREDGYEFWFAEHGDTVLRVLQHRAAVDQAC